MALSEEDLKRLEAEEKQKLEEQQYREEIRSRLNKASAKKTGGKAWMLLLLVPLAFGIFALNSSSSSRTQKNVNSIPTPQINSKAIYEQGKKEIELLKQQAQELSTLFCSERSKPNVRYVNLTDFAKMYEKAGEIVNLRPVIDVEPSLEDCKNVIDICLKQWGAKECRDIAEQKIWIGMTMNQLILSWGLANDTNNSTYSFGVNSQWVYGNPIYGANYVYLEGKDKNSMKVTSWQD